MITRPIDHLLLAISTSLHKQEGEAFNYLNDLCFALDQLTPADPLLKEPVETLLNQISTKLIKNCADAARMLTMTEQWLALIDTLTTAAQSFADYSHEALQAAGYDEIIAEHANRRANHVKPAFDTTRPWQVPSLWATPGLRVVDEKQQEIRARFDTASILPTDSDNDESDDETLNTNTGYTTSDDDEPAKNHRASSSIQPINPFSLLPR